MTAGTEKHGFATRPANPDNWIKAGDAPPPRTDTADAYSARLTVDITPALRGRIKIAAFQRGVTVADMLRDLFAREFPPTRWRNAMTGFQPGRMGGHALPDDAPAFTTLVHLTWEEGRIEHRIRFGRPIYQRTIDRRSRVVGFAPNSVFAFVRWASNEYGTVVSRIDILRAIGRGEPFQTLPFVRPGGDLLLKLHGWPKVERALQLVDAIEALGIDAADAAPAYWRHVHNRLTAGLEPRLYTREQHDAWRTRRSILP